ncbi:hypothetical protein Tco_0247852 [Tanacetum coccineum]
MDTNEKLMPNNGQAVSQLEYSRLIGCLMYVITCTRPDIAFIMGKLSRFDCILYPSVLEGCTDASWINNTEDNSSTIGAATLAKFVRSQQNLADHLTKGLARDLVIKSAEGMGLKGLKHMYLHIIPRMCLEPAEKEDEVVNFLMVNFFEKVLSRSMNKEEPPMYSNGLKGSILRTP